MSKQISDDIKQFSYEICQKHKVVIRYMETDKDHIHYMIETELLASGEISHLMSGENDQSQSDRNNQCISFSFL